jgi:hypothetical protein
MSKTCGDTARFNRLRKAKIARRQTARELKVKLALAHVPAVDATIPAAESVKS